MTDSHRTSVAEPGSDRDLVLSELEQGLLRLGRVSVNANAASRGRDAVAALAARGFLRTWFACGERSMLCGEITNAGRVALAGASATDPTSAAH